MAVSRVFLLIFSTLLVQVEEKCILSLILEVCVCIHRHKLIYTNCTHAVIKQVFFAYMNVGFIYSSSKRLKLWKTIWSWSTVQYIKWLTDVLPLPCVATGNKEIGVAKFWKFSCLAHYFSLNNNQKRFENSPSNELPKKSFSVNWNFLILKKKCILFYFVIVQAI